MQKSFFSLRLVMSLSLICSLALALAGNVQVQRVSASPRNASEITLQKLAKNVDLVYPLVWQKTAQAVKEAGKPNTKLEIILGPESKLYSKKIRKAFSLTLRVFHESDFPPKVVMLVTTGNDTQWADDLYKTLMGKRAELEHQGHGLSSDGNAVTIKRIDLTKEDPLQDPNIANGGTDAHGFTHVIQGYQLSFGGNSHLGVPRWILEGSADFMQMYYLKRGDYENWLLNRNAKSLKQHSKRFLNSYLEYIPQDKVPINENQWYITNQYPTQWAYEIGAYVCDILVALRGPSSLIAIYRDYAITNDFNTSFENIYGIPWSSAKPIVTEILYRLARR